MVEPAKNSIWNYLIPLWQLEQVSSTFGRRGVEVGLTSHCMVPYVDIAQNSVSKVDKLCYTYKGIVCKTGRRFYQAPNSLTTITIVSFFYAISHVCRAPRGGLHASVPK